MYLGLLFLFASLFLCQVRLISNEPIEQIILDYFNCESVKHFKEDWQLHRKSLENAVITALKESVGSIGMNVYIRKHQDELAAGYFHNDNQIRLILQDLTLKEMPRCWWPDVQFSLASNVIKIQTTLSKMIIHASYALIRNKTDIIYEPKDQDPYKSSPFLFQQVQDAGNVAISVERCVLTGFIITTLSGESVNLGYSQFDLTKCLYTIEIYRPGEDSPPVIAKYNPYRKDEEGLGLTHLLMKPLLEEELVPKLQTALFSFVNTSAIFHEELEEYREHQEIVFQATAKYFTELVRNMNRITIQKNNGAIDLEDYIVHWDDGRVKPSNGSDSKKSTGESMKLSEMVLTGLETMYSAHIGGPFKMDTVLMAEEIRFSSLQVRGKLQVKTKWSDTFAFSAEISDMALDLELEQLQSKDGRRAKKNRGYKRLEVKGFRRMSFTVPTLIFGSAESMVGGYLLNVVPKLINTHVSAIFPEALQPYKPEVAPIDPEVPHDSWGSHSDHSGSHYQDEGHGSNDTFLDDHEEEDYAWHESNSVEPENLIRGKIALKKNKKRFKSANRPRRRQRHHGSSKHAADNKIRRK